MTVKTVAGTPVTTATTTSGDVGIQSRCEYTGRSGNHYAQRWCETTVVYITWYWGSRC